MVALKITQFLVLYYPDGITVISNGSQVSQCHDGITVISDGSQVNQCQDGITVISDGSQVNVKMVLL